MYTDICSVGILIDFKRLSKEMCENNKEKIRQHPENILNVIVKNIYIYIILYNIHNMAVIILAYFKNIL